MREVVQHAGPEAAGLDGDVADHDADDARGQRLLQDAVGQAEEHAGQHDRAPLVAHPPQAGEDEAAEGQLLANRRRQGDRAAAPATAAARIDELERSARAVSSDLGLMRIELLDPSPSQSIAGCKQQRQQHRGRQRQQRTTAGRAAASSAAGA